jgi:hypothetical protein
MRAVMTEVEAVNPKALVTTGAPDGFGVWRTLTLDAKTTEMLLPLLDNLNDPRVASRVLHSNDTYTLVFASDRRGDDAKPFGIDRAYRVMTAEPSEPVERLKSGPTRAERKRELDAYGVRALRKKFGYRDTMRKADVVNDILHNEGY